MKIEQDDDGITRVYFRQSWINDFLLCNERARLQVETDTTNEAAALGTALHAGIEAGLRGEATTPLQVVSVAEARLTELESHFTYDDLTRDKARGFLKLWVPMLRKQPEFLELRDWEGTRVEETFTILLARAEDRLVELYLTGTVDAVGPNYLVDWKTASRAYQRWERQRWAVQPTVYAEAARQLGWVDGPIVDFRYVVFERRPQTPEPTVISVTRGPGHTEWLTRMLWRCYDMRQLDTWPLNDQHALCSQKWCPAWDQCKGMFVPVDFSAR